MVDLGTKLLVKASTRMMTMIHHLLPQVSHTSRFDIGTVLKMLYFLLYIFLSHGQNFVRISACLVIGRSVGTNLSGFQTEIEFNWTSDNRTILSGFQTFTVSQTSDNRTLCPVIGHSLYLKRLKTGRFQLDV